MHSVGIQSPSTAFCAVCAKSKPIFCYMNAVGVGQLISARQHSSSGSLEDSAADLSSLPEPEVVRKDQHFVGQPILDSESGNGDDKNEADGVIAEVYAKFGPSLLGDDCGTTGCSEEVNLDVVKVEVDTEDPRPQPLLEEGGSQPLAVLNQQQESATRDSSEQDRVVRNKPQPLQLPHLCQHCERGFATPHGLKCHVHKSHKSGVVKAENPMASPSDAKRKCSAANDAAVVPNTACRTCGKNYASVFNLNRHVYVKHELGGGRVFPCEFCGDSFPWRDELYKHMRKKHLNAPEHRNGSFLCEFCGQVFKILAGLRCHRLYSHRQEILSQQG